MEIKEYEREENKHGWRKRGTGISQRGIGWGEIWRQMG